MDPFERIANTGYRFSMKELERVANGEPILKIKNPEVYNRLYGHRFIDEHELQGIKNKFTK